MTRTTPLSIFVKRTGHPLILTTAGILWWYLGANDVAMLLTLVSVILLVEVLQSLVPANPAWRVSTSTKIRLTGLYALTIVISSLLIAGYELLLGPTLGSFREGTGALLWPHAWPWPIQALLLYFAADLIYYWVHRAIHRFAALWRLTGHGFHHAFQNLGALNAGSNHPFELVLVALPLVLLACTFGARGEAVAAAAVLLFTNTILAHSNLSMETPLFSYLFTTSDQHRRHHSANFPDSNTNYACNAIIWDRLFGTFGQSEVAQTGIGPTQPGLLQLFMLPLREPADADTIATRSRPPK
jgi:sterol desaturase/sphingolipid hydroxylase (fatty acid hydroxylase superfamily)